MTGSNAECNVCRGVVADTAIACVHCGAQRRSGVAKSVSQVLWLVVILGAVNGGITYMQAFSATGAPQQAAAGALACASAIIPYVFARAFDGMRG